MEEHKTELQTRLGCKYADQYYAELLGIPQKEARLAYECGGSPDFNSYLAECPFDFLPECLEAMDRTQYWKDRWLAGVLACAFLYTKTRLIPFSYLEGNILHECSNCKGVIKGEVEFMNYCYRCRARVG